MSGRRLRRAAAAAALCLGAVVGTLVLIEGSDIPTAIVPLLAATVVVVVELALLYGGSAPDAAVDRRAVATVLVGRLLTAALLALAGATVALMASAVPARHGFATGLLGAAAASALFLLVGTVSRRGREVDTRG